MKVPGAAGPDPIFGALRMLSQAQPRMSAPSGTDALDAPSLEALRDSSVDPRLRDATVALEGVFARELVKALRGTVPEGGSPDAPGGQLYTSLLDDHLADVLAGENGLGLSSAMLKQLVGVADSRPGGS